jgi:hypothetical protein
MGAPTTNARAAAARMIPERAEREIAFDVETDGHDDGLYIFYGTTRASSFGTAMRSQVLAVDSRRDVREVAELESLCIDTYRNSVFVIPISTISDIGIRFSLFLH